MNTVNIEVCVGTSCHLLGAMDIALALDELSQEYNGKIVISKRTCLENCGKGPSVLINGTLYDNMTADNLKHLVKQLLRNGSTEQ